MAALLILGVAAVSGWCLHQHCQRERLIEIDRAEPRVARFQVDPNTADWPELAQLPGIGETLAQRIVESRETEGLFLDHEDLRRVRGIGPKTLDRMRPYLLPMPEARALADH